MERNILDKAFDFSKEELDGVLYGYLKCATNGTIHAVSNLCLNKSSEHLALPGNSLTTCGKEQSLHSHLFHPQKVDPSEFQFPMRPLPSGIGLSVSFCQVGYLYGVFCNAGIIEQGRRFGPFSGETVQPSVVKKNSIDTTFMWEVFAEDGSLSHYVDGTKDQENWLKYVNCARHVGEQNMNIVQVGNEIYYETSRDIKRGSELLVWYSQVYSQFMGLPLGIQIKDHFEVKEPLTPESDKEVFENHEFVCERCGKTFAYESYLEQHLKYTRCVDQGDRKFPCHLCSRSFEKRDRLRVHILHVHEKYRPHQCNVCGKSFSQSSSLNKHLRIHSGEKPYKCPHCEKAFTASSILRTHIRQHSGEKPFKCSYCDKAFASHAGHDSHVRRTHTKEKPCVCHFCGKGFVQSYELKFHLNMHTGEKPYECEKCGRRFSSPSSRDRHRANFDCLTRKNRAPKKMRNTSHGQDDGVALVRKFLT